MDLNVVSRRSLRVAFRRRIGGFDFEFCWCLICKNRSHTKKSAWEPTNKLHSVWVVVNVEAWRWMLNVECWTAIYASRSRTERHVVSSAWPLWDSEELYSFAQNAEASLDHPQTNLQESSQSSSPLPTNGELDTCVSQMTTDLLLAPAVVS